MRGRHVHRCARRTQPRFTKLLAPWRGQGEVGFGVRHLRTDVPVPAGLSAAVRYVLRSSQSWKQLVAAWWSIGRCREHTKRNGADGCCRGGCCADSQKCFALLFLRCMSAPAARCSLIARNISAQMNLLTHGIFLCPQCFLHPTAAARPVLNPPRAWHRHHVSFTHREGSIQGQPGKQQL